MTLSNKIEIISEGKEALEYFDGPQGKSLCSEDTGILKFDSSTSLGGAPLKDKTADTQNHSGQTGELSRAGSRGLRQTEVAHTNIQDLSQAPESVNHFDWEVFPYPPSQELAEFLEVEWIKR